MDFIPAPSQVAREIRWRLERAGVWLPSIDDCTAEGRSADNGERVPGYLADHWRLTVAFGSQGNEFDKWQPSAQVVVGVLHELGLDDAVAAPRSACGACAVATVTKRHLADLDKHTLTPVTMPDPSKRRAPQVSVARTCALETCGAAFVATTPSTAYCSDDHARLGKAARARERKAAARAARAEAMV